MDQQSNRDHVRRNFVVIGLLDLFWLGFAAKDLYRREMGSLMAVSPRLVPAAVFYLTYPLAILFFALLPLPTPIAAAAPGWLEAFCDAAPGS